MMNSSMMSIINELWGKACEVVKDTETIAQIRVVVAQMASFDFLYGLILGEKNA